MDGDQVRIRSAALAFFAVSIVALGGTAFASALRGTNSASRYSDRIAIHLPRDNAMHPWSHSEWWYVVGHLSDRNGQRFGFETTLFKFNHLRLPGSSTPLEVDRADVALTDVTGKTFQHSVTYLEPGLAPINLSSRTFSERLGSASLRQSRGIITLQASVQTANLRLSLTPSRPAILEGGAGIVPMGPHGFSYYYSLPYLRVSGKVHYQNRWTPVSGIAWLDHQWGNWSWAAIRGWTWGAFQLDNGVDFSASSFRTTGRSLHGVTVSFPRGPQLTTTSVTFKPTGYWRSRDGTTYGSGWIVTVPKLKARLIVRPLVTNQEVYDHSFPQASYWEGDCSVSAVMRGRKVKGVAYMELVGGSRAFRIP